MWVKPSPMPSAVSTRLPSATPPVSAGCSRLRTVTMTGLIHSLVRAISGLGRYCATFMNAGLPPMHTVSNVNSSPSMNSSRLHSGTCCVAVSARSRSASLSTWKVSALPAPAIGLSTSG
jgi:hypothetical protein